MKIFLVTAFCALVTSTSFANEDSFGLTNPYSVLTTAKGEGEKDLYGTTLFRVVLKNKVYLGGSNNIYLKPRPRPYDYPLSPTGLKNLCENDFSKAFALSEVVDSKEPREVKCWSSSGRSKIESSKASLQETGIQALFEIIYQHLMKSERGRLFIYDSAGNKESAFLGGLLLKQFCGWTSSEVVSYFENTSGAPTDEKGQFSKILRDFVPWNHFKISPEIQDKICF